MKKLTQDCIKWIRDWFDANGPTCTAVLGMSGGKDSTIAAALCAKALGPERVVGIAMPAEGQSLNEADEICAYLGIKYLCLPIGRIEAEFDALEVYMPDGKFSLQTIQNIPPRIRMTALYAAAQSLNGMVANTCNLSEDYIGYATLFGDAAGSFSPPAGWIKPPTTACPAPAPTRPSSASHMPLSTDTSARASAKMRKSAPR